MSNRERLVLAVGGLIVAAIGVSIGAVYLLFIWPADDCDVQARKWKEDIAKANALIAKQPQYEARLADLAGHVFGDDEMVVSEQVRTTVTNLLTMSGLSTQNLSLKPLVGTRVPNVYREIGWSVQTRGKLEQVINFMYLMTRETHLHRVDNVVLAPAPGGEVSLQVKYATLLLEMPGVKLATNTIKDQTLDPAILNSDEHHLYDIIATRDLLRPFIERPRRVAAVDRPKRQRRRRRPDRRIAPRRRPHRRTAHLGRRARGHHRQHRLRQDHHVQAGRHAGRRQDRPGRLPAVAVAAEPRDLLGQPRRHPHRRGVLRRGTGPGPDGETAPGPGRVAPGPAETSDGRHRPCAGAGRTGSKLAVHSNRGTHGRGQDR